MRLPTYSPTLWNAPTGTASASPPGSKHTTTSSSKCVSARPRSPEAGAVKNGTTNNDTQSNFLSRFTALILGRQGVVRAGAPREKLKDTWDFRRNIALLYFLFSPPTQMDDHPSSSRRKKSDKAKEKHERNPYSSQHVRQVIANAIVAAATKAGSGSRKNKKNKNI